MFDTLGRAPDSLAMLETAWTRSPSPWKEEAGVLLAERYNQLKEWDKAGQVARRILSAGPDATSSVEQRARRALVEALYWSQDDASVLTSPPVL